MFLNLCLFLVLVFPAPAQDDPSRLITPDNADQLTEIWQVGRGVIVDMDWYGDRLAVAAQDALYIYDSTDLNAAPRRVASEGRRFTAVSFAADGERLFAAATAFAVDNQTADTLVIDPATGTILGGLLTAETDPAFQFDVPITDLRSGAEGDLLLSSTAFQSRVFDVTSGALLSEQPSGVSALTEDGRLLVGNLNTLRVIDLSSDSAAISLDLGDGFDLREIITSPDGRYALLRAYDGLLIVLRLSDMQPYRLFQVNPALGGIDFSSNSQQILYGDAGLLVTIDIESGQSSSLSFSETPLSAVMLGAVQGQSVALVVDGKLQIVDSETGMVQAANAEHPDFLNAAFSFDGRLLLAISGMGELMAYSVLDGSAVFAIAQNDYSPALAVSPRLVALGDGADLRLLDVKNGADLASFSLPAGLVESSAPYVAATAFRPDYAAVAALSSGGVLVLYDIASEAILYIKNDPNLIAATSELFWLDASRLVLVTAGGELQLLAFDEAGQLSDESEWLQFSPTGSLIAYDVASQNAILGRLGPRASLSLVNLGAEVELGQVQGSILNAAAVWSVPGNALFMWENWGLRVVDADRITADFARLYEKDPVLMLNTPGTPLVSPDGSRLVLRGADGTLRLFALPSTD